MIDPITGAALLNIGGNLIGNMLGKNQQTAANKANMKLAQYQWQKNLEMWNLQNQYNSPLAQMQRLKDAGLNPNMVYGSGSAANVSKDAPSYEAPHLQAYTNFGNLGSDLANSLLTGQQIKNLEQQNKNLEIDASMKRQQMLNQSIEMSRRIMENRALRDDYQTARDLVKLSLKQAHQDLANSQVQERSLNADVQLTQARVAVERLRPQLTEAEYKSAMARLPGLIAESAISQKSAYEYEEYGIRPSDPLWSRAVIEALEYAKSKSEGKPTAHETVKRWVRKKWNEVTSNHGYGSKF